MNIIDKFLDKYSYSFYKGYIDINDPIDQKQLNNIFENLNIDFNINEVKAGSLFKGSKFTIMEQLGNFPGNTEVIVDRIIQQGDDIKVDLIDNNGVKDTFIFDKNDEL
jgi:hypothetical protein